MNYLTEEEIETMWALSRANPGLFTEKEIANERQKLNEYLELFISNSLQSTDTNFKKFEIQKGLTMEHLKLDFDSFGKSFVARELTVDGYLFLHSLIVLEYLNYLEIKDISERTAPIILKNRFFEANNIIDSETLYSDGILQFNKKRVTISDSEDSEQHFVMDVLFKNKNKNWSFDEIAESLERDYAKNDSEKYYGTFYKINKKIEKETGFTDFLQLTSKEVQINKKYLP